MIKDGILKNLNQGTINPYFARFTNKAGDTEICNIVGETAQYYVLGGNIYGKQRIHKSRHYTTSSADVRSPMASVIAKRYTLHFK